MSKTVKILILLFVDFLTIQIAFFLWCRIRGSMGFFVTYDIGNWLFLSSIVYLFWFFIFLFFGQYQAWHTRSRTDEFIDIVKIISIGVLIIFLLTFDIEQDLDQPFAISRILVVLYWALMIGLVGFGRLALRSFHRKWLAMGYGRQRTIIVGWGKKAWELFNQTQEAPALGYDILGFVSPGNNQEQLKYKEIPVLASLKHLHSIVQKKAIHEVFIALPRRSERQLEEVIAQCDGLNVEIKIVPDLYDVMVGQVRTNQIYGFPLIEILPQLITPWERFIKRLLDIALSLVIIIGFLPFWLVIAAMIRLDSKGPVFYLQERVGKKGKLFNIFKFRSMIENAEHMTGPVWASENDKRMTRVGKWLRKLRLDEIPQFINVLFGQMSLVGPRPERPFFVKKLKRIYPLYVRRLRIRPGITGWAQVKGEYDQSLEHVKQKLEYDLFYLENMSLRMDLKIFLHTVYVILTGKGQ